MEKREKTPGFTLIELMIVVAIIGILAAIAIPQFANLLAKSTEGRTKANLGTIRSALSIYYGDNDGYYPTTTVGSNLPMLSSGGRYLLVVPNADLPGTPNNVGHLSSNIEYGASGNDAGGWTYDNSGINVSTWGKVTVNCTHQDLKASPWSTY